MLTSGFDRALILVDELLPALYLDHPRADIRSLYRKRLRAYALEPPLVTQLPKEEAGSDTEASANAGERNPHPDVTLPGGGITPGELAEPDFDFPGQAPESRNALRKRSVTGRSSNGPWRSRSRR